MEWSGRGGAGREDRKAGGQEEEEGGEVREPLNEKEGKGEEKGREEIKVSAAPRPNPKPSTRAATKESERRGREREKGDVPDGSSLSVGGCFRERGGEVSKPVSWSGWVGLNERRKCPKCL